VQGSLKEALPHGKREFFAVRVDPQLVDKLLAHGVVVKGTASGGIVPTFLSWAVPAVIFYIFWFMLFRGVAERQGLGGLKVYVETDTKVTFKDVAEAKFELEEVVSCSWNPRAYGRLGADCPRAFCSSGPRAPARRCWHERSRERRTFHSFPYRDPSSLKSGPDGSARIRCVPCLPRIAAKRYRRRIGRCRG
jgi:hypothetical protein